MEVKKAIDFEVIKALILMFIPLVLVIANGGEIRPSISNFVYYTESTFKVLLCTTALLYFQDGYTDRRRWYNMLLALCLVGVAYTPHLQVPFWHYLFALNFFIGNDIVMIWYSSKKQRIYKIIASLSTIPVYFLALKYDAENVFFWAESYMSVKLSLHLVGEKIGKID